MLVIVLHDGTTLSHPSSSDYVWRWQIVGAVLEVYRHNSKTKTDGHIISRTPMSEIRLWYDDNHTTVKAPIQAGSALRSLPARELAKIKRELRKFDAAKKVWKP